MSKQLQNKPLIPSEQNSNTRSNASLHKSDRNNTFTPIVNNPKSVPKPTMVNMQKSLKIFLANDKLFTPVVKTTDAPNTNSNSR